MSDRDNADLPLRVLHANALDQADDDRRETARLLAEENGQ